MLYKIVKKTLLVSLLLILFYPSYGFKETYYLYVKGLFDLQNKNYKSAIGKFEKIIQEDKQALDIYPQLIYLYILENKKDKIENILPNIEKLIPDIEILKEIGNILILYGYRDLGIEIFEKILKLMPENKDILLTLAQLYSTIDQEKSLTYYKKYLTLNPNDTSVYLPIAVLEYRLGNIEEAKRYLQGLPPEEKENENVKMIEQLIISPTTYYYNYPNYLEEIESEKFLPILFYLAVLQNNLEQAEKLLNKIKKLTKNSLPEYNFYIAIFYEKKQLILQAIKYMSKFIRIAKPNDQIAYIKLAYYYMLLNKINHAQKVLINAVKKFNSEDIKKLLFYIYLEKKNYKDAVNILEDLKTSTTTFDRINFYLGYCYDQLGNFEKTVLYMKKAIEENPTDHEALNYLGYLYADKNINLDEAEQLILQALSYDPTNYAYIDSLGWVYYRKKMYKEAQEQFEKIKEANDPVIYEHIGDLNTAIFNYKEAIKFYKKSLELNPKNTLIKRKLKELEKKLKE